MWAAISTRGKGWSQKAVEAGLGQTNNVTTTNAYTCT